MTSKRSPWILALGFLLLLAGADGPAWATSCGATITTDTTLSADLDCSTGSLSHGLTVGADNITLDCAWHTITGPPGGAGYSGVRLVNRTGVTVKNCIVESFAFGIKLEDSPGGNHLRSNTAEANEYGFHLSGSDDNILTNNTAQANAFGFRINTSSGNLLRCNTAVSNTDRGFSLTDASSNTLRSNDAYDNRFGFDFPSGSTGNDLDDNTADSNSIDGFVLGAGSDGNAFSGNTANDNGGHGFHLAKVSGNTLTGNVSKHNGLNGFHIVGAADDLSQNALGGNSAIFNGTSTAESIHRNGIFMQYSTATPLRNNEASDNTLHGISLAGSVDGLLEGNTTNRNGSSGVGLYQSSDANVLRSNVANENTGNGIYLSFSTTNTVEGNTADDNDGTGFVDNTSGAGTAGTDNTYDVASNGCAGNGSASSPSGLCAP